MNVLLNGEEHRVKAPCSLHELISGLLINAAGCAVALNGKIVRAPQRATQMLKEGDRVELIRAVGGG